MISSFLKQMRIQIWNEYWYDSFPVCFTMVATWCQVWICMASFFIVHMIDVQHHIHGINEQTLAMDFLASLINVDPCIRIEVGFMNQSA